MNKHDEQIGISSAPFTAEDEKEWLTVERTAHLSPATENPWYVLATAVSEQVDYIDADLHAQNRRIWNGWMCQNLDSEHRKRVADGLNLSPEDLTPLTAIELELLARRFKAAKLLSHYSDLSPDLAPGCNLTGLHFKNPVSFDQFFFPTAIDFSNSVFEKPFTIQQGIFNHETSFEGAIFKDYVVVEGSHFKEKATFDRSLFQRSVSFNGADFHADVSGRQIVFFGDTSFDRVEFQKFCFFTEAIAMRGASFLGSKFRDEAYFNYSAFGQVALFNEASFGEQVSFECAKFSEDLNFDHSVFHGQAIFFEAIFCGHSIFSKSLFDANADFSKSTFCDRANFENVTFQRSVFFREATLLGYADFRGAEFKDFAGFQQAKLSEAYFSDVKFKSETYFWETKFLERVPHFFQTEVHQNTVFTEDQSYWPAVDENNAASSKQAYTRLRQIAAGNHNPDLEHFFMRQEMRCKEVMATGVERFTFYCYRVFSDSGSSFVKPLLWLLIAWLIPGFIYLFNYPMQIVEGSVNMSPLGPFGLSFSNLLVFLGLNRIFYQEIISSFGPWLTALAGAQSLVGVVLLFLLGLGLRNRFRLK